MGYKTIAERKEAERQTALLWLFLNERGLLQAFTEYCRECKDMNLDEIDNRLRQIINNNNTK